ncbi:MAG TPA: O-methyltransferase [Bacillota bacterium]
MDEYLIQYLKNLLPPKQDWVIDLERQAKENNVPIMDPLSMNFVMQLIRLHKPKRILEIGTAIGYSALCMLEANPKATITTIEKDEKRYEEAFTNIKKHHKENRIKVIHGDAFDVLEILSARGELFDCIFIDASKAQYKRFFKQSVAMLNACGLVISDNVLFKGHIAHPEAKHPRYKTIIKRLRAYNQFLANHAEFTNTIVPIGDGIAISYKQHPTK